VFVLGQAAIARTRTSWSSATRGGDAAASASAEVTRHWDSLLGAVQVKTPDDSFDVILNGWLLYQTLACRVWARSGYYQPGGAFGFRDQLQDVMALAARAPRAVSRAPAARGGAAVQGRRRAALVARADGKGTRTRCSDDMLFLPYAAAHYVETTATSRCSTSPPASRRAAAREGEHDVYNLPSRAAEKASLFRALPRARSTAV